MFQDELFSEDREIHSLKLGFIELHRNFFNFNESLDFLDKICESTNWQQSNIIMHGKEMLIPRLNAWYAQNQLSYSYSGIKLPINNWTPHLTKMKALIEAQLKTTFNSCLLNLYRDGQDSVSWHADDERELGKTPTIASISLGAERKFSIRHKSDHKDKLTLTLPHNSLLIMKGTLQQLYEHQVPKMAQCGKPRLNLTFRRIIDS